jgi:NAD(P)H-dependent FMN reductase
MLNVGLIVGSTRPNRFADRVTPWVVEGAATRKDMRLEKLDLRDFDLPLLNEPVPPSWVGGKFNDPKAQAWGRRLAELDAFIAITPEYNHGPSGALKNAFDSAYLEWARKPIAFVGYGGAGGVRAIEHLRGVVVSLDMIPVRHEVTIAMEPYLGVAQHGRSLNDYEFLVKSRAGMFEQLVSWGEAMKTVRLAAAA